MPETPPDIARRVADRVTARRSTKFTYTVDLALEAMLEVDRVSGTRDYLPYAQWVMRERGYPPDAVVPYEAQPFCHLNYKLYEATDDERYVGPFIEETARYRREVTRSAEGAIAHYREHPGRHLLIDMLQDYASRMAQAGALSGDESFYAECVEQHRIYRSVVRDPESGLWCQGRGWLEDPMRLSPGAWSRGQGWVMRGMVDSLSALPRGSKYAREMEGWLRELADALVSAQASDGSWHQLLHLPPEESCPDSTGTGLVCYNMLRAVREGFLAGDEYRTAALRAWDAVARCVTEEGIVTDACPGPGPLRTIEPYVRTPGLREDGESHGPGCVLFACAGRMLAERAEGD